MNRPTEEIVILRAFYVDKYMRGLARVPYGPLVVTYQNQLAEMKKDAAYCPHNKKVTGLWKEG